jgi:protein SCO1/2
LASGCFGRGPGLRRPNGRWWQRGHRQCQPHRRTFDKRDRLNRGNPWQGETDQNGKPVSDADLKGKWQLVFFGYTHCPDACPTALNEIALALDRLGAKRDAVEVVFITVDPERDTPEVLKAYVASFDAPIIALTGAPDAVAQAAGAYRVFYAKHPLPDGGYDMDHSAVIYVMNPEGRFTATFTPDSTAEAIADRLQKLLS